MVLAAKVLYEFGPYRLDPLDHLLLSQGKAISLTPKAFDLLLTFVTSEGHLLTKNELLKRVWPDSFVEEANLTVNISLIRRLLGETDDGQPYIETVPKRGYRFVVPVREIREVAEPQTSSSSQASEESNLGEAPQVAAPITQNQVPASVHRTRRWRRLARMLAVALLVLLVPLITLQVYRRPRPQVQTSIMPRRLAIVPFQNLTHDPTSDFLGFSLVDAVITKLGYVGSLTVRPSSAVEKYRNQVIDISKIATELNVDALLTGTYIREGDQLRVTCQLVDAKTQTILRRGVFDIRYAKLLTVHDSVAQQIIEGLGLALSASEAEKLRPGTPVDPLAYEYYLRGVDLYSRGEFSTSIKMLTKSAELDARYAPTWAHLGRAYNANASFLFGGRENYAKAQAAYEKALALQPSQIEARIFMANLLTDTGRVERAVPVLREALKTNANHAEVHWELGYAYRFGGMLKESAAECERARELDPGVKLNTSALNAYLYLGEYDKFLASLPENSDSPFNLFYRGFGEYYLQQWDKALNDFDRAVELDRSLLQAQVGEALSDAIRHRQRQGLEILRAADGRIADRGVGDPEALYKIAQAYAALGDKNSALRVLRRSIENGFFPYPYFRLDPLLDSLRNETEFKGLMEISHQRHEAFARAFF